MVSLLECTGYNAALTVTIFYIDTPFSTFYSYFSSSFHKLQACHHFYYPTLTLTHHRKPSIQPATLIITSTKKLN